VKLECRIIYEEPINKSFNDAFIRVSILPNLQIIQLEGKK